MAFRSKPTHIIYTINGRKLKRKIRRGRVDMQLLLAATKVVTNTGEVLKWRR